MPSAVAGDDFFDRLFFGGISGDSDVVNSVDGGRGSISSGESAFTTQSVQSLTVDVINNDLARRPDDDRPRFAETAPTENECSAGVGLGSLRPALSNARRRGRGKYILNAYVGFFLATNTNY